MMGAHAEISPAATAWEEITSLGPRFVGSEAEQAAGDCIVATCVNIGLEPEVQAFAQQSFALGAGCKLALTEPERRELAAEILLGSPPTEGGALEGRLRHVGTYGVIGLLEWERFAVEDEAGHVLAFVVGRPDGQAMPQPLTPGSLPVPHVAVGQDELAAIAEYGESSEIRCCLRVDLEPLVANCRNLIVRIKGGGRRRPIFISAHYDSMHTSPGANDNAGGVVALLALAHELAERKPERDVALAFFAAEEWNLAGSRAYVAELRRRMALEEIRLAINLDGIAAGPALQGWVSSEEAEGAVRAVLAGAGERVEIPEFRFPAPPGSDHVPFAEQGVSVLMLTRGEAVHWHQPTDRARPEMLKRILAVKELVRLLVDGLD